jgi:hypothetical protein
MAGFVATAVAASDLVDLNTRVVVLAESEQGDGARLEISRAIRPTTQDRALGQDTYCLSTQTGATIYGGVTSYAIEGDVLRMQLATKASSVLGVPRSFSIALNTDVATIERVRVMLKAILAPV